jgi:uncharacterized membrane protein
MLGPVLVFAHISLMFLAVMISYGPTLMFLLALRTNRVENLRAVGTAVQPVVRLIPGAYVLAAVFGVLAAVVIGYNLLAPWLFISYVLFIVLLVIGAAYAGPHMARVGAQIADLPDGPIPAEVRSAAGGRFVWFEVLDFLGLLAVIYVMVAKPFS